jgi:hypothetical protein
MLDLHQVYATVSGKACVLQQPGEALLVCDLMVVRQCYRD